MRMLRSVVLLCVVTNHFVSACIAAEPTSLRTYENRLTRLIDAPPLLADYPEFVEPVRESVRYEAPLLVDDEGADLAVRAWRFSYNARGIIEMPNRLRADRTAVIMVHPWGIDDGQGWNTPEPAGVADFCTPEKNHLAGRHTREVIRPLLDRLRGKAALVMYSLRGEQDPIRHKLYRSLSHRPTDEERRQGARELQQKLAAFEYRGQPLPATMKLSADQPVIDYFRQFPGLDAGPKFNNAGFWNLPIPVSRDVSPQPDDVVIYDAAGYENLSRDFNVFLVGDATLATFPANSSPRYATNAHISFAALNQLITQASWIRFLEDRP